MYAARGVTPPTVADVDPRIAQLERARSVLKSQRDDILGVVPLPLALPTRVTALVQSGLTRPVSFKDGLGQIVDNALRNATAEDVPKWMTNINDYFLRGADVKIQSADSYAEKFGCTEKQLKQYIPDLANLVCFNDRAQRARLENSLVEQYGRESLLAYIEFEVTICF